MKWYKHDANASQDAKLKKVRIKYGMEGYGVYWYCLELIAKNVEKHNLSFELEEDSELIANETGIHQERIQEMMVYMVNLGLFEESGNRITCLKMATRTDEYTQKLIKNSGVVGTLSGQTPDSVGIMSDLIEEKRREEKRTEQKRKEKDRKSKSSRFTPPEMKIVIDYFVDEKGSTKNEAEKFFYFYDSKNWMVGPNKMKIWKSSASGWITRNGGSKNGSMDAEIFL